MPPHIDLLIRQYGEEPEDSSTKRETERKKEEERKWTERQWKKRKMLKRKKGLMMKSEGGVKKNSRRKSLIWRLVGNTTHHHHRVEGLADTPNSPARVWANAIETTERVAVSSTYPNIHSREKSTVSLDCLVKVEWERERERMKVFLCT
jgi:hypothetical protein